MAWLSTKDGRHFNTDWIDEDQKRKEEQIRANQEAAKLRNSVKEKSLNEQRQESLKAQQKQLEKNAFNKDAQVALKEVRARLDEHRRFQSDREDMNKRLNLLKQQERDITRTDAFNPQARSTLRDLRARIDEITKILNNYEHSY